MRFLIASFVLLFGVAELYQWIEGFRLPLPLYVIGGIFLAIASNYEKDIFSFLEASLATYDAEIIEPTATISQNLPTSDNSANKVINDDAPALSEPRSKRPISFTIKRPKYSNNLKK